MLGKIPPDKTAVALAQCYEVMGEHEQAAKHYEAAIEKAPNNAAIACVAARFFFRTNQTVRGEEQLTRIIDGQVDAEEKTMAWARRALASVLFARGGNKDCKRALELIEENLAANPSSAPDLYVKAMISAARAGGKGRREAIPALEKLVAKQDSPLPEVLFTLAKAYLDEGRWDKFKERMRQLVDDHGNEPRYVATFAEALVERKELQEAEVWLKQLEQIAPDDFATVRLRAEFEVAHRRFVLALTALKRYLESPTATNSDRAARLLRVATSMEKFAGKLRQDGQNTVAETFADEAETVFREYAAGRPGAELLLAEFLARQGRFDDAMKLAEERWESGSPEMIAAACFALLQAAAGRPEEIQRVGRVLQDATKKHEQSTILLIVKAVLRGYQGRYQESEAIYRAILEENPTHLTAMNNLALFLALEGKKPDEALRLVQRAIRRVGPVPVLLDTRAVVRLAMGQPDKALDDLNTAIEDTPTALRYFHQAQAYYQLGRKKDAIDALKMAHKWGLKEEQLDRAERRAYRKLRVILK
jgi:tetratricopeptide (TPR) repeat protein